jgi:hypothetical protein
VAAEKAKSKTKSPKKKDGNSKRAATDPEGKKNVESRPSAEEQEEQSYQTGNNNKDAEDEQSYQTGDTESKKEMSVNTGNYGDDDDSLFDDEDTRYDTPRESTSRAEFDENFDDNLSLASESIPSTVDFNKEPEDPRTKPEQTANPKRTAKPKRTGKPSAVSVDSSGNSRSSRSSRSNMSVDTRATRRSNRRRDAPEHS